MVTRAQERIGWMSWAGYAAVAWYGVTRAIAALRLFHGLDERGTPAVNVPYPVTNRAFDFIAPQASPPVQAALSQLGIPRR